MEEERRRRARNGGGGSTRRSTATRRLGPNIRIGHDSPGAHATPLQGPLRAPAPAPPPARQQLSALSNGSFLEDGSGGSSGPVRGCDPSWQQMSFQEYLAAPPSEQAFLRKPEAPSAGWFTGNRTVPRSQTPIDPELLTMEETIVGNVNQAGFRPGSTRLPGFNQVRGNPMASWPQRNTTVVGFMD